MILLALELLAHDASAGHLSVGGRRTLVGGMAETVGTAGWVATVP